MGDVSGKLKIVASAAMPGAELAHAVGELRVVAGHFEALAGAGMMGEEVERLQGARNLNQGAARAPEAASVALAAGLQEAEVVRAAAARVAVTRLLPLPDEAVEEEELRWVGMEEVVRVAGATGEELARECLQLQQAAGALLLAAARVPGAMSTAVAEGLLALPHEPRAEDLRWVGKEEAEAVRAAGVAGWSVRPALVFLLVRRMLLAGTSELLPAARVPGMSAAAMARAEVRLDASVCRLAAAELAERGSVGDGCGRFLEGTLEAFGEHLGVDPRTARRMLTPVKLTRKRWLVTAKALESAKEEF